MYITSSFSLITFHFLAHQSKTMSISNQQILAPNWYIFVNGIAEKFRC